MKMPLNITGPGAPGDANPWPHLCEDDRRFAERIVRQFETLDSVDFGGSASTYSRHWIGVWLAGDLKLRLGPEFATAFRRVDGLGDLPQSCPLHLPVRLAFDWNAWAWGVSTSGLRPGA